MTRTPLALLCAAGALVAATAVRLAGAPQAAPQATPQQIDFFESKIRPLLVNSCFDCHTADEKGGLRLDSRQAALKGGESGPAIVPGDPDGSLLMKAVRHVQGVSKMPRAGGKLSDADIAALAEWITMGAPWPAAPKGTPAESTAATMATGPAAERPIDPQLKAFWSFQPIRKPAVPQPANASWAKTDIDRFVLARLEREGMAPVGTADKRTLIRRATLDLTGLPATLEEIEAFQKDESPDAFARVVDRLLASPRYGETWGRLWLDVARYGEDDPRSLAPMRLGYAPYPNAYLYRDWVIKAFNDDLPYDQFVKAQIAADHLDEKLRVRHLPALGFLGLGPWYYDNGSVEITRADERHDRVDVVSRGFLGLTVACARCHDHKYDPISAKDYYAFSGVFLNTSYTEYPMAPKSVVDAYKATEKKIKDKQRLLNEFQNVESTQLGETLALQAARYMQAAWKVLGEPKEDVASVAAAEKLDYELFDRWVKFLVKPPKFYPYLTAWQQMIKTGGSEEEAEKLAKEFQELLLEVMFEQREVKAENDIIRAKALPGTKPKERANLPHEFVTNDDFCPGCGLELKSLPPDRMHLWVDVFLRNLRDPADAGADPDDEGGRPGLLYFAGWTLERWLGADRRRYVEELRNDIAAMRKTLPEKYAYVHGVKDVEKPVEQKLHIRGNPMREGDVVPRRFLPVLSAGTPAPLTRGSGRLDLAEQILQQPITMRVIVNRVWKWHFGTGIVDTPSNFGKLGEPPTNPELLEYLAQSFIDSGYSIKALHRQIMLTSVYQLSVSDSAVNHAKDAGNRFYWRASRRRMSAEQIRDSVLFVSGSLDSKMGGPSVALTPAATRRTVYGKVSRYKLDQYLQLFDFPAPTISAEQRFTTNVPLQRLFFMNSEFVQQQAERIAQEVQPEPDNPARIRKAYRMIFGREPNAAELKTATGYLAAEPLRAYEERRAADALAAKDPAAAKKKPASAPPPAGMGQGMMAGVSGPGTAGEAAKKLLPVTALGRYVRILLSSPEFIFID
ncbi:MAG TPA: PSD1 and planctomycete cytochrome C domain-containing protein [Vicinamibacterales bacterium]|nr:PSD1 and planctomycete cytochrome C domain-containing protein [Vicinamibacterales bacterium]